MVRSKHRLFIMAIGTLSSIALGGMPVATASSLAPSALQVAWMNDLTQSDSLAHATVSAYAFDVTTQRPLANIQADWRQTPASVTKLITSALGLSALGPQFRYRTDVRAAAAGDTSSQPLYLVGGGDPLLEANDTHGLEQLAQTVAKHVKSASRVVGVSNAFAPDLYGTGWNLDDVGADYGAGTSALMVERSELEVRVVGTSPGQRPPTQLIFNSTVGVPSDFTVVNHAVTSTAATSKSLVANRTIGTNLVFLSGTIQPGAVEDEFVSIGNPAQYAATLFQQLLRQDGVHFQQAATTGALPNGTSSVGTQVSKPLAVTLKMQNQFSVNQMAENLYRMSAVKVSGDGSLAGAQRAMTNFLIRAGVDMKGLQMVDGSGVSPLDDMSARQVVQVLRYAANQSWFSVYEHSLMELNNGPNGGILLGHHFSLPAGTQVWLKTGNLSTEWNYAGYAHAKNGDLIAFAILDNGPSTKSMAFVGSTLDQMVDHVAAWPADPGHTAPATGAFEAAGIGQLPSSLGFLTPRLRALSLDDSGIVGMALADVSTGRVVWSQNGSKLLPAGLLPRVGLIGTALTTSPTMKLGPITVLAHGKVAHGVLHGWLTIVGHGSPTATTADLQKLASLVARDGVTSVDGRIHYISTPPYDQYSPAMVWNDMGQVFAPPIADLMVDGDQVRFTVQADAYQHTTVTVSPINAPVRVVNRVTVDSTAPSAVSATYRPRSQTYLLTGHVRPLASTTVMVAPPNAAELAARVFRDALVQSHVSVPLAVVPVSAASGWSVAALPAVPVDQVVKPALNQASTALLNPLAMRFGANVADRISKQMGGSSQLQEPFGLSLENTLTPDDMARDLAHLAHQSSARSLVIALSQGLWDAREPEVRTLAGYVRSPSGHLYSLVIMNTNLLWRGAMAPTIAWQR